MSNFRTPVLKGLKRPDELLGVDVRVLLLTILLAVGGAYAPLLFFVAGAVFILGLTLAKISPNLLTDTWRYMLWRFQSWDGLMPDESGAVEAPSTAATRW